MPEIEQIVRGVIKDDNKILLCHGKGKENWFFPGGHIDPGETAPVALKREIKEELNEECEVGEFLGICENSYVLDGNTIHEVNQVYEMELPAGSSTVSQENHLEFKWFTVNEMNDLLVYPISLRNAIINNEKGFTLKDFSN